MRAACSQIAFRSAAVNLSRGPGAGGVPAAAELGQGQVRGELPAAEPHRATLPGGVASQRDGVPGDLAGVAGAEPLADQHAGPVQAGEELLLAGRPGGRGADRPPECDPGGLLATRGGGPSRDSARVGRRAAVRSRGAVRRSPNRCSAARHASPTW